MNGNKPKYIELYNSTGRELDITGVKIKKDDGDIVYIRKQNSVENGEIAAVLIDGVESESEATLKRFFRENDKIRLSAENPMYADKQYYGEEMNQVRVIGKAVAFLSTVR